MGRDIHTDPALKRQHRNTMSWSFKSPFTSVTLIGVLISLLSKFVGIEISHSEATTALDAFKELWPLVAGLGADLATAWYRLRASNFNQSLLETRTFWAAIASGALTMIGTFGFDVTGFEALLHKGLDLGPGLTALAGMALAIFGRWKAKQKIAVQ